ncbi:hypothetical protein OSH11_09595 [Kaistia dalseonensis]|uniref:Uncharacterized protein n=1 Tax=Kaistia dalseonensis TaxID=410840 RepID=A0ABU0H5F4_9HYPH|nr:hypothetical protein [Kaistia dalseonensis]MCX5494957.1 hypothetical protein [Kaistia dalseonensis]MDQ0437538.1 hypothetical protein [Kaistia dalseonensis]
MTSTEPVLPVDPLEKRPSPAGPHDKPELTNPELTPGTGALPDRTVKERDVDPGAG